MSQQKIEAFVFVGDVMGDKIMVQDITIMVSSNYTPVLRMPTVDEMGKLADGCQQTLKAIAAESKRNESVERLLDMLYEKNCEIYGVDRVRRGEDNDIFVMFDDKERRVWVQ